MTEQAVFGAGCFWGVEAAFGALSGVVATAVGYCGGRTANPTYQQVCTGRTGHAEAVQVTYDPDLLSYAALVTHFLALHDPTQRDRQGPDIGTQYRSVIFVATPEQERIAKEVMQAVAGQFKNPIATSLEPDQTFWRAEAYHQQYFAKNGGGGCHV